MRLSRATALCSQSFLLVLLATSVVRGQAAPGDARVDSLVDAFFVDHRTPGLSVAVWHADRLVYRKATGLADVENSVPVNLETVFRIASVTKPLTATGVLLLAQSGRLDLSAPIQDYCRSYPAKRWPTTSLQLLSHTGGLRVYLQASF
jgi:CubicO group peptidase (beta-lactamase class C family)